MKINITVRYSFLLNDQQKHYPTDNNVAYAIDVYITTTVFIM